jgi:protein involved in polysaccharide export with SLBB domain
MDHRITLVPTRSTIALGLALGLSTLAAAAPIPPPSAVPSRGADKVTCRVEPLQVLWVHATGIEPNWSLDGPLLVEPGGTLDLGPAYGKVALGGLTFDEADDVITEHLQKAGVLHPKVFVSQAGVMSKWRNDPSRRAPYHIKKDHVLKIQVLGGPPLPSEDGLYTLGEDGSVDLGPEYGRPKLVDRTLEEAASEIRTSCSNKIAPPQVSVTLGGWEKDWRQALKPLYRIKPFDVLQLKQPGALRIVLPDGLWRSLDGFFLVGPDGKIPTEFGQFKVAGLTLQEATAFVADRFKVIDLAAEFEFSVRLVGRVPKPDPTAPKRVPRAIGRIKPADILRVRAAQILPSRPIDRAFRVGPDGAVHLGAPYGVVNVKDLTLKEAAAAIEKQLKLIVADPKVQVSPGKGDDELLDLEWRDRSWHRLEGGPTRHLEYLEHGLGKD